MSGPGEKGRLGRLAERAGMTEGQLYTTAVALVLAASSAAIGLPPVLNHQPAQLAAAAPPVTVPPTTTPPVTAAPTNTTARPSIAAPRPRASTPSTTRAPAPASPPPAPAPTSPPAPRPPAPDDSGAVGERYTFAIVAEIGRPADIAIGTAGDVWSVARGPAGEGQLVHHDAAGTLLGVTKVAGAGDVGLTSVAIGPANAVIVTDGDTGEVLRIEPTTGQVTRIATIPDVAPCLAVVVDTACQPGPLDTPARPSDIVVAADGALLVTDASQATVWRVAEGGDPQALVSDEQLLGANDDGLTGIDIAPDGSLLLSLATSAAGGTGGAVYRVAFDGGAPATPELVATTGRGTRPAGIAVGASGTLYVALSETGAILVLEADGTERTRLPEVTLAGPLGLAFRGASLMLATADAGGGAIIRVPVGEASA